MKKVNWLHVLIAVLFVTLLAACGPWSRDTQCVSGVRDWTGCVPSSDETQAFLKKEGYWAFPPVPTVVIVAPTPVPTLAPAQPTAAAVVPTVQPVPLPTATPVVPSNPLFEALSCLGFESPHNLINYFQMEGVDPEEITVVPDGKGGHEPCAVRVLREKDANGYITPFLMTNPTSTTFDGWRSSTQPYVPGWNGSQAQVPPDGPWLVEGVTIRPFNH